MASKQRKRRRKRRAVKKAPPLPPVSAQAEEEKARTRGRRSAKGWRACLFGIGLLCALWTALAVSLPPTVLRGVVESQLSEAVNAPVTIESLSVNPFTLGIAVRGVRVPYLEETGTPDGALLTSNGWTSGHASGFSRTPPPFRPPSAYTIRYSTSPISAMGCFPSQNCCPRRAGPTPPLMPRFSP